jgi:DNA polymerase-3 subunit delta'
MKIIGHEKQLNFLNKSIESKKISHAYLFSGQEKLGKKTIALEWASSINGKSFQEQDSDFIFITPEEKKIQIFQIRDLIWRLSLKSSSSSYKISVINDAHCMGIDAQHALLKTLEEPKGDSVIILITDHPEVLFPTVRSRCETVKFYPVSKNEIISYLNDHLKEQNVSDLESIALLSRGRPGEAIEFVSNSKKLEERKKINQQLDKISKSFLYQRFKLAKDLSQQDNLKETIEIWLDFLREKLINSMENGDAKEVNNLKNKLNLLQKLYVLVSSGNVNSKLALESLFINI